MRLLNAAQVRGICDHIDLVGLVSHALIGHAAGRTMLPAEAYMRWDAPLGGKARTLNMPAYVGGATTAVGTKIINGNPKNVERGLPRASGLTLLFDQDTGRIRCAMDAAFISARRTAAVSALALLKLHLPETPLRLGVFGAGYLAKSHIELFAEKFAIEHVALYDIDEGRSRLLQQELKDRYPAIVCDIARSPSEVTPGRTCILAATTVTVPYLRFDHISAGSVLLNVSLDDFAEDVFQMAAKIYVDDVDLIEQDHNRTLGKLLRDGRILRHKVGQTSRGVISGTIGQILSGEIASPRDSGADVIMVNPFGMAVEDIAIASEVFRIAIQDDIGEDFAIDDFD